MNQGSLLTLSWILRLACVLYLQKLLVHYHYLRNTEDINITVQSVEPSKLYSTRVMS